MPHRSHARRTIIAATLAAFSVSAQAEVITVVDPPFELTTLLDDWAGDVSRPGTSLRKNGSTAPVGIRHGKARLRGDDHLHFLGTPHPNRFPFVRIGADLASVSERRLAISASPHTSANTRVLELSSRDRAADHTVRLPPDKILTSQPYFGNSLRLALEEGPGSVEIDYVMVDAVPTRALAEFNSPQANPAKVEGVDAGEVEVVDGHLRIPWTTGTSVHFQVPGANERHWDALEFRARLTSGSAPKQAVEVGWTSGRARGSHRVTMESGNGFHTYRLHVHKVPTWTAPEEIRLELHPAGSAGEGYIEIDYLRLRDFANPGGGNISKGIYALDEHSNAWEETARLLDRWRFVAGQSYSGNQARAWKGAGRSLRANRIRWETDHPTWKWLIERTEWPRHEDGSPDLQACARLAYDSLNTIAWFLQRRGAQLDAVHFDGLLKRLILPKSNPRYGATTAGGLLEYVDGNHAEAYRLAAETFCRFMELARNESDSALTNTHFFIQPNFHVWEWRHGVLAYPRIFRNRPGPGNFHEMMRTLEAVDRAYESRGAYKGPSPLAGYGADWVFMDVQPRRLAAFEWCATEEFGREFNVVNNGTADSREGKSRTPEGRSRHSLLHLLKFRSEGGRPTSYTPYFWQTTWREAPPFGENGHAVLPETEPHTVTWTLLQSARLCFFMEAEPIPGLAAEEVSAATTQ